MKGKICKMKCVQEIMIVHIEIITLMLKRFKGMKI